MLNGPVLAEDKDTGPNAVVKYRLLGARVDLFTVDADTGGSSQVGFSYIATYHTTSYLRAHLI